MGRNIFILKLHAHVSFEVKRIYSSTYHEGIQGRWGVTSLILNLNTRWMSVVNLTPRLLYPRGCAPQYHCRGGRIGLESIWTFWRRGKFLVHAEIQTLDLPAHILVAVLTTLSWFLKCALVGVEVKRQNTVHPLVWQLLVMQISCNACISSVSSPHFVRLWWGGNILVFISRYY